MAVDLRIFKSFSFERAYTDITALAFQEAIIRSSDTLHDGEILNA